MKKQPFVISLIGIVVFFGTQSQIQIADRHGEELRTLYSRPSSQWPRPTVDSSAVWQELSSIPQYGAVLDDQDMPLAALGKLLFFDPKLSGSNQISCSSCHDPHLSWADGREISLGNDHLQGNRNTISILNVGHRKALFWDGRAGSLQEQALQPIGAHHEMAMDFEKLPKKLNRIKGYRSYFLAAFGKTKIDGQGITDALAAFQKTIRSRRSRFDDFVDGDYTQLSDQEIEGLHLFRTKARCINCHSGPYFTDNQFHNIGLTYYQRELEDLGRYKITKNAKDVGRFQTPMLRDVMATDPWMHNGLFDDIKGVISMYNSGMHLIDPSPEEKAQDPLFPVTDELMKPLELTSAEIDAIAAFLQSITATQYKMSRPELPK